MSCASNISHLSQLTVMSMSYVYIAIRILTSWQWCLCHVYLTSPILSPPTPSPTLTVMPVSCVSDITHSRPYPPPSHSSSLTVMSMSFVSSITPILPHMTMTATHIARHQSFPIWEWRPCHVYLTTPIPDSDICIMYFKQQSHSFQLQSFPTWQWKPCSVLNTTPRPFLSDSNIFFLCIQHTPILSHLTVKSTSHPLASDNNTFVMYSLHIPIHSHLCTTSDYFMQ